MDRQVVLLNCQVMAQMSVPPVPVPGGDWDHLFEKIRLQHSWYLSCCFLWNPREQPLIMVGEAVTICEGQIALCRSSSLFPSLGSSVLCFAGLLLSASSPPCGRGNSLSFPLMLQQPGMQSRVRGLLLSRGVRAVSIITSSGGRQRQSILLHRFPVCCIGKGWLPGVEAGRGCGAGSRTQRPGELEDRKRGPEAMVVVSTPERGSSWARQEGGACGREQETVRDFHVRVHWGCSCSHLSSSAFWTCPAARYLPLPLLQASLAGFAGTKMYFLVVWLSFQGGEKTCCPIVFPTFVANKNWFKKSFDYNRSFKK